MSPLLDGAHRPKSTRDTDTLPDGLWEQEDKDSDGVITWEEFGGPKGSAPGSEEL